MSLRSLVVPSSFELTEIPAPKTLAPYTAALEAHSRLLDYETDNPLSSGRLIILYDPAGREEWEGCWRLVSTITGKLDESMGEEQIMGQVGWSWLSQPLIRAGCAEHLITGTVTRVLSEAFGGLLLRNGQTRIEIRASWSPQSIDLAPSAGAWLEAVREAGGIAPEGIATLHR